MRRGLWSGLPLVIGVLLFLVWRRAPLPDPVLFVRADLATTVLLIGMAGSALWGAVALAIRSVNRRWSGEVANLRREQGEAHRRFVRRLEHELKNPVTAIRAGLANLSLVTEPATPEGQPPGIAAVRSQVDRLARLGADLRKLADLETIPLEREPVDLTELLHQVLEDASARPGASERRVRLSLPEAPWPLPCIAGDHDLLFLAFYNLVDNALKFSHPGDTVEVRGFEDGRWVVVIVADTGPGIAADELPHLGEELFRGANARGTEGSGLGLALARAVVARHGGDLSVSSRPGEGTAVSVRLPVH
ncbi:MAG: HAMP domain-containing histidine kinase [Anaerolineae bacterium]|nr:HAMP domain-containing histidine kinase [Anaerolineae bacterium]